MSKQPLAALVGYQLDEEQFKTVASIGSAINSMAEAVVRLAPPLVYLRIVHKQSGFTIEGVNLKMNLKNNEQVEAQVIFKNAQGGPAAVQPGSVNWSAVTSTNAFTVEKDLNDETKALVKGDPQNAGGPDDVGVVKVEFDGDAGEGQKPRTGEGAINVIPGDADIMEVQFGTPTPQQPTA